MNDLIDNPDNAVSVHSRSEFERIRRLIREFAGIALSGDKVSMVQARLMPRLRVLGMSGMSEYLDLVQQPGSGERQEFINLLTTNLTSFFREKHHFASLETYLGTLKPGRPVRIWCSAASTGEEVWSIAASAHRVRGASVEIIGTDIDTSVLGQARVGVYPKDNVASVDRAILVEYFQHGKGRNAGQVRIGEKLRPMVKFAQLNLIEANWPIAGPFDAIFCRNVMIYFETETQHQLVRRFHSLLTEGGMLFVGHSETFRGLDDIFRLVGRSTYVKIGP